MRQVLGQLTYARVVSTLALFIALGGGAYAISLGKNDVKSRNIKNSEVKSADVKDDSLKGRDIVEGTLDTKAFTAAASTPFSGVPGQPIKCDPEALPTACGDVTLNTPVAGRILVLASGELTPVVPTPDVAAGSCRLNVDGKQIGDLPVFDAPDRPFSLSAVSDVVPAGAHKAELRCLEDGGEIQAQVFGVTAVLVGGG